MKRKTPTQTETDLAAAQLLIADLERENGITRAALNLSRERAEDAESDLTEMTDRANAAELELAAIRKKEDADQADLDAWMDEEATKQEAAPVAKLYVAPSMEAPEVQGAARELIARFGWPAMVEAGPSDRPF